MRIPTIFCSILIRSTSLSERQVAIEHLAQVPKGPLTDGDKATLVRALVTSGTDASDNSRFFSGVIVGVVFSVLGLFGIKGCDMSNVLIDKPQNSTSPYNPNEHQPLFHQNPHPRYPDSPWRR